VNAFLGTLSFGAVYFLPFLFTFAGWYYFLFLKKCFLRNNHMKLLLHTILLLIYSTVKKVILYNKVEYFFPISDLQKFSDFSENHATSGWLKTSSQLWCSDNLSHYIKPAALYTPQPIQMYCRIECIAELTLHIKRIFSRTLLNKDAL
jgi:hypothetical protein